MPLVTCVCVHVLTEMRFLRVCLCICAFVTVHLRVDAGSPCFSASSADSKAFQGETSIQLHELLECGDSCLIRGGTVDDLK